MAIVVDIYEEGDDVLYGQINEIISRAAAASYSSEGVSLYDSIRVTSADRDTIGRFRDDAIDILFARFRDILSFGEDVYMTFDVPDFADDTQGHNAAHVVSEVKRFIVLYICSLWFKQKAVDREPEYTARAQASLNVLVTLLRTRKTPSRR